MASLTVNARDPFGEFVADVSQGTALDEFTVRGWIAAEGGPSDNPLNIGPGRHYGDEAGAAQATIALLRTAPYASVWNAAHKKFGSELDEIHGEAHAIAYSPWKGDDGLPRDKYESNIVNAALTGSTSHSDTGGGGIVGGAIHGIGGAVGGVGGAVGGAVGGVTGAVHGVGDFLSALTNPELWIRFGLGLLGLVALALGLYKAFG